MTSGRRTAGSRPGYEVPVTHICGRRLHHAQGLQREEHGLLGIARRKLMGTGH
jgi:hypothetical protein